MHFRLNIALCRCIFDIPRHTPAANTHRLLYLQCRGRGTHEQGSSSSSGMTNIASPSRTGPKAEASLASALGAGDPPCRRVVCPPSIFAACRCHAVSAWSKPSSYIVLPLLFSLSLWSVANGGGSQSAGMECLARTAAESVQEPSYVR